MMRLSRMGKYTIMRMILRSIRELESNDLFELGKYRTDLVQEE